MVPRGGFVSCLQNSFDSLKIDFFTKNSLVVLLFSIASYISIYNSLYIGISDITKFSVST